MAVAITTKVAMGMVATTIMDTEVVVDMDAGEAVVGLTAAVVEAGVALVAVAARMPMPMPTKVMRRPWKGQR